MNYGMPYMGSKNGVLELIHYVVNRHPEKTFFIDMFAGGGSASHYILVHTNMKVIMNDKNEYVMNFYREILFDKSQEFNKIKYEFVDRERFLDVRDNPHKYSKWYVGYVLTLWSFGNRQLTYMYGKEIEHIKKALHKVIVDDDFTLYNSIDELKDKVIPQSIRDLDYREHKQKRREIMNIIKDYNKQIQHLERAQQLERLEQLALLESLGNLERLHHLSSKDWQNFYDELPLAIKQKAVFYCDPPYEETATYREDDFSHDKFWAWFRSCPFPVYASSYDAPSDIKIVKFEEKIQTFSSVGRKRKKENIYWNGKGDPTLTLEDMLFNS